VSGVPTHLRHWAFRPGRRRRRDAASQETCRASIIPQGRRWGGQGAPMTFTPNFASALHRMRLYAGKADRPLNA
jgi:hypothetical protein